MCKYFKQGICKSRSCQSKPYKQNTLSVYKYLNYLTQKILVTAFITKLF